MFRKLSSSPQAWGPIGEENLDPLDNPEVRLSDIGDSVIQNTHRTVFCNDPRSGYQFGYKVNTPFFSNVYLDSFSHQKPIPSEQYRFNNQVHPANVSSKRPV